MSAGFSRLLIAARGESACRIARAARHRGMTSIAVYSHLDAGSAHTRAADEAHCLPADGPMGGYLSIEATLDIARRAGAEALHPGYGFLSENAAFAQACVDAGLVFVGPTAAAMAMAASKATARDVARKAGLAVADGFADSTADDAAMIAAARKIGFPVLIKAVAGGGGRGQRLAQDAQSMPQALAQARREAKAAFGDDALLLEAYITEARHIETQVLADGGSRVWAFAARDCSLQRRRQKVIEESPPPGLSQAVSDAAREQALTLARAMGWRSAGTIEFLLDTASDRLIFLEVNARLQVEHPITEAIHGVDLVDWQLRIACGEGLDADTPPPPRGWAMEARVCAEDPFADLAPSGGRVRRWEMPRNARIDSGVARGDSVPDAYDSMLAKVIVHKPDRNAARVALAEALAQTRIAGLPTNTAWLRALVLSEPFAKGEARTDTLAGLAPVLDAALAATRRHVLAMAAAYRLLRGVAPGLRLYEPARALARFSALGMAPVLVVAEIPAPGRLWVRVGDTEAAYTDVVRCGDEVCARAADGRLLRAVIEPDGAVGWIASCDGLTLVLTAQDDEALARLPTGSDAADGVLRAPMQGVVREALAQVGDLLAAGAPVLAMEAMKLDVIIEAPFAGRLAELACAPGASVRQGAMLARMVPEEV